MGLFDKVKDVGKAVLDEAKASADAKAGAAPSAKSVKLDNFKKDGIISSKSLPVTKSRYAFCYESDSVSMVIAEEEIGMFGCKYKLATKVPLVEFTAFRITAIEETDYPSSTETRYRSVLTTASGEEYKLVQTVSVPKEDATLLIKEEMDQTISLNGTLTLFVSMVDDEETKRYYNEIYAARGTDPVFDDKGAVNTAAYQQMHKEWFTKAAAEWKRRMSSI